MRKVRVPLPNGQMVDGLDVPVFDSDEKWANITLEDGTVFRLKTIVSSAVRIEGQWDAEGNPLYFIKSSPAVAIVSVPDELRRKVN